jgi:hypothetical protein
MSLAFNMADGAPPQLRWRRLAHCVIALALALCPLALAAQESPGERSFPQSKAAIEKALQAMQSAKSGRLPTLDGFATPAAGRSLDHYQRGFYQGRFQVSSAPNGGSTVRVIVQLTAYFSDPSGAKSGYQVLPSNGRIEADLLDQLSDRLGIVAENSNSGSGEVPTSSSSSNGASDARISPPTGNAAPSAPSPRLPEIRNGLSASLSGALPDREKSRAQSPGQKSDRTVEDATVGPLQAEFNSLQEVLKNQGHPKNLVAVKNSGTPVVASASLTARTLFLATAHDEFEMLDFNRDWVHVKISGLSRGWIWRNNLEMPGNIPEGDASPAAEQTPTAARLFHVSREEVAPFPGDWAPLRNKNVKIVSVEQVDENAKDLDPRQRLEFAKSILDKDYAELAKPPQSLEGIVLIFDSADGGMIAATVSTLQQWKKGSISDAALWHQCFFDPPETFAPSTAAAASR